MTHPTDDEIMELAGSWFHTGENQKRDDGYYYRSLGTPSNVRGSDLIEFARALLAEQARTQTHKAEEAPSDGELLDWLEAHLFERKWSGTIGQPSGWYMAGPYRHTMQHMRGESLRAAIRAAIAQERKA